MNVGGLEITGPRIYKQGDMVNIRCRLMGAVPYPPVTLTWAYEGTPMMQETGARDITLRFVSGVFGKFKCV